MRHLVALLVIALFTMSAHAANAQMSISFEYRFQVNIHAPIVQLAGIRFVGARFEPLYGAPFGTMHFDVSTTDVCNIQMFTGGSGGRPIFDSGRLFPGIHPMFVYEVPRGIRAGFEIVAYDCYGRPLARDIMHFWTPPPEIVTEIQWEQVTISQRTVRVGYR